MAESEVNISLPEVPITAAKLCDTCGRSFAPDDPRKLCCTPECQKEHGKKKARERLAAKRPGGGVECLECNDGTRLHTLAFAHLRRHGLTTAQYLAKHPGAKLSSPKFAKAVARTKLGRLRINYTPMNRNGKPSVNRWETVRLRVANKSTVEISRLQECTQPPVFLPLQQLGLTSGSEPCFSFGQVFDRASIATLYDASGLKKIINFAQEVGMPFSVIERHLAPRSPKYGLSLKTARKIAEWRHQLFSYLMSNAGRTDDSPRQNRVLRTFFPNLKERYGFLREMLARIGQKDSAWTPQKLKIYLLEEAARGDKSVRQFLPWAVELMPFLENKLEQLRGPRPRYQQLAYQLIAEWLGTTPPIISVLVNPAQARGIKPIPPEQMRWLILNRRTTTLAAAQRLAEAEAVLAQRTRDAASQPKKGAGEPGRKRAKTTDEKIELAGKLLAQGKSERAMSTLLYPTHKHTPDSAYTNTRRLFSDYCPLIYAARDRHLQA